MGGRAEFVAVVGLPRSGTTLLTLLLDRHRDFHLYFEPWNASPKRRPAVPQSLEAFRCSMTKRFGGEMPASEVTTGFKETTTNEGTTGWAVATARTLAGSCAAHVVWIQRDPIHCLLSKIEGAKRWWGHEDARMSKDELERFLVETCESYRTLASLVRELGGSILRYADLAQAPAATLSLLMTHLGAEFEPSQLDFAGCGVDRNRVMGDPSLIESPAPVSLAATRRRAEEALEHRVLIDTVLAAPRFAALMKQLESLASREPVSRYFEP